MNGPFRVGEWLVEPLHHRIGGPGGSVKIEPRVMRLLQCLADRAPETVTREEILKEVWDGVFVGDDVLTQSVSELRKAFGDDTKHPRFVATVPKRGYRLIAPVEQEMKRDDPGPPPSRRLWTWAALALGAGLWALGVATFARRDIPPRSASVRFALSPPPATSTETLRISPDGTKIAFLVPNGDGVGQIWIHDIETGRRESLRGTDGALHLFWSPDSRWVAFSTFTALKKIRVSGGELTTVREAGFWWGGTWGDEGVMVLSQFGQLYRLDSRGGEPTRLDFHGERKVGGRVRPELLPGGRNVLYFDTPSLGPGAIYVGSLETGDSRFIAESDSRAIYADGYLLWIRGNALTAQRFDLERLRLEGQPSVIEHQLVSPAVVGRTDAPFSASREGTLVFRGSTGVDGRLVWFDRDGRELGRVRQPSSGEFVNPAISPNGRMIAANRRDPASGNLDIWLIDVESQIATRFTTADTPEVDPVWSPDGERIAFASVREGKHSVWVKNVAGGSEEILWDPPSVYGDSSILLTDWSADGTHLLCFAGGNTWLVPLSGVSEARIVLEDTFEDDRRVRATHAYTARFSPDSHWIAYTSNETGAFEVYVMRTSGGSYKQRLSSQGGIFPLWRADGQELYYWGGSDFHGPVMRVGVEPLGDGLRASTPERLLEPIIAGLLDSRNNYAVTADGQRFLLRRPSEDSSPVHVIVHWTATIER